jgi:hypothetical protein
MTSIGRQFLRTYAVAALALLLTLGTGAPATAIAIYGYEANTYSNVSDDTPPAGSYNTTDQGVSGSFTLDDPLPTLMSRQSITGFPGFEFSFEDGCGNIIDSSNDWSGAFEIATTSGQISGWLISLTS